MSFRLTDFLKVTIENYYEIQDKVGGDFSTKITKYENLNSKLTKGVLENEPDYTDIIDYICSNIDKLRMTNNKPKIDFLEKECVRFHQETYRKFQKSEQLLEAIKFTIHPETYPKFSIECLDWILTYLIKSDLRTILTLINENNPSVKKDLILRLKQSDYQFDCDFWSILASEELKQSLSGAKEIFHLAMTKVKSYQMLEIYLITISEYYENPEDALKFLKPFYELNKKLLTPSVLIKYAELTKDLTEKEKILEFGYRQYPELPMAIELLKIKISLNSPDLVTLFELFCLKKHPELPIIKLELKYLLQKRGSSKFEIKNQWYLKYINSKMFSDKLSIEYLEWMAAVRGTVRLREAFLVVMKATPTMAVMEAMIKLENGKSSYVTQALVKGFCDIFGTVNTQPWIYSLDMNLNDMDMVYNMARQRLKQSGGEEEFLEEFKEIIDIPIELS